VRRDEVGSGDDNFEDWTAVLAEKVDLVDHDQPDGLTKIRIFFWSTFQTFDKSPVYDNILSYMF
jgi:hypothetical protein